MQTDLLDTPELIPPHVMAILEKYQDCSTYEECAELQTELEQIGYTIEYYLDAQPFNLRTI